MSSSKTKTCAPGVTERAEEMKKAIQKIEADYVYLERFYKDMKDRRWPGDPLINKS